MTSSFMSCSSILMITSLLLASSSLIFISEARPLKVAKSPDVSYIKSGGPSSGGRGHKYINAQTVGGIEHSGPAPGIGNCYTTRTPQVLGGIKHSGPSHAGVGNHCTTGAPRALVGGIKHSGPSHGGVGNLVTNYHTFSGPSPHGPGH